MKSLSNSHAAAIAKIVIFTSRVEIDNLPSVHVAHGKKEMGKGDAQCILKSAALLKSIPTRFWQPLIHKSNFHHTSKGLRFPRKVTERFYH